MNETSQAAIPPSHLGLSQKYWSSLSDRDRGLYLKISPMREAVYSVQYPLSSVEEFLAGIQRDATAEGGTLELEPDFQRGHVWTEAQQVSFMESLFRGRASSDILFNCPGWTVDTDGGDIPRWTFQCVDGLQRLTAVRRFMAGDFALFGDETVHTLAGSSFGTRRSRYMITVKVFAFANRADLLSFYLLLNSGGTPHTAAELDRVRALREQASAAPTAQARVRDRATQARAVS